MSLHVPSSTYRGQSSAHRINASRRRNERQGGLLPSATVAAFPTTPGADEIRRRQHAARSTRRDQWRNIQQRNAVWFHDLRLITDDTVTVTIAGAIDTIASSLTTTEQINAIITGDVAPITSSLTATEQINSSIAATISPIASNLQITFPVVITTSIAGSIDPIQATITVPPTITAAITATVGPVQSDISTIIPDVIAVAIAAAITVTSSMHVDRYGMEPDAVAQPTILFGGARRRRYYDPNRNPVTGPSGAP